MESESMVSSKIVEELRVRTIKNFMDVLILTELKNGSLSGYDLIAVIHRRFDILLSPATVYAKVYSLERDGLIKGSFTQQKRVFELTDKGEQNIKVILKANEKIQNVLRNVLLLNATEQSPTPT